jgi:hypothetical protein
VETLPPDAFLNVYRTNRKQIQDNTAESENLRREMNSLEQELKFLGVEKRFQKRLKDLDIQNAKNLSALEEVLALAGKEIFENHKDFRPERAERIIGEIELCLQRGAEYAGEKKRLEAAVEYDRLTRKIHDLREDVENEQKAASFHREKAEKLKIEIAETEKLRTGFENLSRREPDDGNSTTTQ